MERGTPQHSARFVVADVNCRLRHTEALLIDDSAGQVLAQRKHEIHRNDSLRPRWEIPLVGRVTCRRRVGDYAVPCRYGNLELSVVTDDVAGNREFRTLLDDVDIPAQRIAASVAHAPDQIHSLACCTRGGTEKHSH